MAGEIYSRMNPNGAQSALAQHLNFKRAFMDAQRQNQVEAVTNQRKLMSQEYQQRLQTAGQMASNEVISPTQFNQMASPSNTSGQIPLSNTSSSASPSALATTGSPTADTSVNPTDTSNLGQLSPEQPSPSNYIGDKYIGKKKAETHNLKYVAQQDRLEKIAADRLTRGITSFRSGAIGLQDAKVNQAIHLRSLINQMYDSKTATFNIPPVQYEETAIGLANLLSGTNVVTDSMRNGIRQKTSKGDFNGALTYLLGIPKNASTQAIFKNLISSIDRQGQISEQLRDKDFNDLKKAFPSGLSKERADNLKNINLGSSYKEFLGNSPDINSNQSQSNGNISTADIFKGL